MTLPDRMKALLLNHEGYSSKPTPSALEAMEPYVTLGEIGVPRPSPSQVLVKVTKASERAVEELQLRVGRRRSPVRGPGTIPGAPSA